MRQLLFSPRWLLWHALTLGAMATCGWLAVWQWQKAGSAIGSALNIGYGLQWPVFALFFAYMWWRMLRMELHQTREETRAAEAGPVEPEVPAPEPAPQRPSPFTRRPAAAREDTADEDPVLADYNRMLAELSARYRDD